MMSVLMNFQQCTSDQFKEKNLNAWRFFKTKFRDLDKKRKYEKGINKSQNHAIPFNNKKRENHAIVREKRNHQFYANNC